MIEFGKINFTEATERLKLGPVDDTLSDREEDDGGWSWEPWKNDIIPGKNVDFEYVVIAKTHQNSYEDPRKTFFHLSFVVIPRLMYRGTPLI